MIWVFLLLSWVSVDGHLLSPGIITQSMELFSTGVAFSGYAQSALNQTEVQVTLQCLDEVDIDFEVQVVLRSSPCNREFFDARNLQKLQHEMQFYFNNDTHTPRDQTYERIVWYKSPPVKYNCKNSHQILFYEQTRRPMEERELKREKRAIPSLNGDTIDGGAKITLTSWHPIQKVPIDSIYFLIIKLTTLKFPEDLPAATYNISATVEWRAPHGYLSAIDFPLLRFYIIMCAFYSTLAMIWLYLCIKYYKDILRIQYWIGGVIILGMLEKAFYLSEYSAMNSSGVSTEGILEVAELVSCAKRTMSRVLVIIVSVGYGVVKPRLGNTLSQVAGVGFVYFVFCAIEGLARVSKNQMDAMKQKQFAALPLVITEMIMFYWIYSSLGQTMTTLRIRRNEMKLSVYRHFTNTLLFAAIASLCFMAWDLIYHVFPACLHEWKGLWINTAFWHVLFCSILVVIMFLWRPSQNNQRYAFTPLLDDSEDENEDEIFNSQTPGYEVLKMRDAGAGADTRRQKEKDREDQKLQDDLKWIEDHIPASLTDHLMIDEEDEKEVRELEMSKML